MTKKDKKDIEAAGEEDMPEEKPAEQKKSTKSPFSGKKALSAEVDRLNERLVRLQADFENFRKRTLREKNELFKRANEDIMQEMLPVLDHMDLALEAAEKHGADKAIVDGFSLVGDQLLTVLERFGLKAVDAAGERFDPNLHEAISHMASDEVPDGCVMEQPRRGYMLGDKLLRAAQVVVSRGGGEGKDEVNGENASGSDATAEEVDEDGG